MAKKSSKQEGGDGIRTPISKPVAPSRGSIKDVPPSLEERERAVQVVNSAPSLLENDRWQQEFRGLLQLIEQLTRDARAFVEEVKEREQTPEEEFLTPSSSLPPELSDEERHDAILPPALQKQRAVPAPVARSALASAPRPAVEPVWVKRPSFGSSDDMK